MKLSINILLVFLVLLLLGGCKKEDASTGSSDSKSDQTPVTLTGNVMDVACGNAGKGMDGSEISTSPQDHSKKCLVACAPSGYGIMYKEKSADFYTFLPFDDDGSEKALELINTSAKEKDIKIEVSGVLVDGKLKVASLIEK